MKLPKSVLYGLHALAGLVILLVCSLFQQKIAPEGEYHVSEFLKNSLIIPAWILFFVTGFLSGYFLRLNPWLSGILLFLVFPLVACYEATVYKGSHNLIPFELIIYFVYSLPSILAVYLGKYIYSRRNKGKE